MASSAIAGDPVTVNGRKYRAVREGLAQILAPYRESVPSDSSKQKDDKQKNSTRPHNNDQGDQAVFYNPIQQYNRDLSVLAILVYGEGALAEKAEKFARKSKRTRSKNAKRANGNAATGNGEGMEVEASRKRKVEEVEEADEQAQSDEKKMKINEQRDEDDIEVQQHNDGPEVDIVTEQASEPAAKAPAADADATTSSNRHQNQIPFTILDALSASGLRAIRYAKEIPFTTNVVANDLSPEAVKSIELNVDHNQLRGRVHSNVGDARAYMYSKVGNEHKTSATAYVHRFDVIDLDPYGTAAPFLDAALQALADGGLLCVTCTDAGVFASNGYPEKAYALYDGITMKGAFSHEAGLRLIIHAIATSAARYGIAVEPLLSLSIDFYARLFIRVHKSPQQVKLLGGTTMTAYSCDFGCGALTTQPLMRNQEKKDRSGQLFFKHSYAQGPSVSPLCDHCGSKMHVGGPLWAGPIHNPYFIQKILDKLPHLDTKTYHTTERVRGMLTVALEEDLDLGQAGMLSPNSEAPPNSTTANASIIPCQPPQTIDPAPFFFIPNYLAKVLHCSTPPEDQLRGAIRHLGYKVSRSHCKPGSFKTNAPWDVLWEIMREWVRQHAPVKEGKVTRGMPGWKIMQKMRGTNTKNAMDVHESIKRALERGTYGKDELKSLLESGLYRLAHPEVENTNDEAAESANAEQHAGSEAVNGKSSKPAWNEDRDVGKLKIVFDAELGKNKAQGRLVRYQTNPSVNWGPMNRAGGAR